MADLVIGNAHMVECHTVRRTVRFKDAACTHCKLTPEDGTLYTWGIQPVGITTVAWMPGAFCSAQCHEAAWPASA